MTSEESEAEVGDDGWLYVNVGWTDAELEELYGVDYAE